jgi:hypothetical protein
MGDDDGNLVSEECHEFQEVTLQQLTECVIVLFPNLSHSIAFLPKNTINTKQFKAYLQS